MAPTPTPTPGAGDPSTTPACALLSAEQLAPLIGEVGSTDVPFEDDQQTQCVWNGSDGRSVGVRISYFLPPDSWLRRTGTAVAVGDEAYVEGEGATLQLEADIKGWLVDMWAPGNEAGAVTVETLTAIGQLLDATLIANPNDISPGGPGVPGDAGDPGSVPPLAGGAGVVDTITLTVDTPEYLAGSATAASDGSFTCANFGDFFEFGFRLEAPVEGLVVERLLIQADSINGAEMFPARFDLFAEVPPPGGGFPFVEVFSKDGTVTWDGSGSGTFTMDDDGFGNSVTGTFTCTFQ